MLLTLSDIKKITFGAVSVIEENGVFVFNRFTEKQKDCYKKYRTISLYGKTTATAGIRFSFKSNTSYIKFNYYLSYGSSRDFAYFDIYVNGQLTYHIGKEKLDDNVCALECKMPKIRGNLRQLFPFIRKTKLFPEPSPLLISICPLMFQCPKSVMRSDKNQYQTLKKKSKLMKGEK